MYEYIYSSTIYNSQKVEIAQISSNGWIDKQILFTQLFYHKTWNNDMCCNVNGPQKYYTIERNQTQKLTYCKILFIWNIQNW